MQFSVMVLGSIPIIGVVVVCAGVNDNIVPKIDLFYILNGFFTWKNHENNMKRTSKDSQETIRKQDLGKIPFAA